MARSTQEIGLNKHADTYLDQLEEEGSIIHTEQIQVSKGMFGEPVYGNRYHLLPRESVNSEEILEEVVQDEPWSSGPMIFTYLRHYIVKRVDNQVVEMGYLFAWVLDPRVEGEVDYEQGHYWV